MDVVIFGSGSFASLYWYVLDNDSPHQVVGFAVDRDYLTEPHMHGLPVVAFEDVEQRFDPANCGFAIAAGWQNDNELRARKHAEAIAKGYTPVTYISSRAQVWSDLRIGKGCMVFEGAIVQPFARIGDGVILRSGCNIGHHVEIGDFCFIAADVVVGGNTRLGRQCFVGLNATLRDNLEIGERSLIGAAAYIPHSLAPGSRYAGVAGQPIDRPEKKSG